VTFAATVNRYGGISDDPVNYGGKKHPGHAIWCGMLGRCRPDGRQPTYRDCTVAPEWLRWSNFRVWWEENHVEGWCLDKDLLVPGNRVYGPTTCMYVPRQANNFFLDHGAARGDLPQGVRRDLTCKTNPFMAMVSIGKGKKKSFGHFPTPEAASVAYRAAKLLVVEKMSAEMLAKGETTQRIHDVVLRKAESLFGSSSEGAKSETNWAEIEKWEP
jgi:hypothetical protein